MVNKKYNKRLLELARSIEGRLKKLPVIIRKACRSGSGREIQALRRVENTIEIIARETARQRMEIEKMKDAEG